MRALRTAFHGALAALAWLALAFGTAAPAHAGDAVRLLIEPNPLDLEQVLAGEQVDLQIVGEDAQKTRVNFGGRVVEVSATVGVVEHVSGLYRYRYRAPANVADVTTARIRAWLKEAPEVSGEFTVRVLPPAPFRRLVWQGPGSSPGGASIDLQLRGEAPDGQLRDVPEGTVTVRVEGPGKIQLVRTSRYRFDANEGASGSARVTATLNRYPEVKGVHDVLVTGGSGPTPAPPPATPPAPKDPPKTPDKDAGKEPPTQTPPAPETSKPPVRANDEDESVLWTGGNVRVEAWRVKATAPEEWGREREGFKSGGEFVSILPWQKLRIATVRKDVSTIEVEEQHGIGADAQVRKVPVTKDGRLTVVNRKDGTRAIHYEANFPEGVRRIAMTLTLTYADGKTSKDTFVLRRPAEKR